MPSHSTTSGNLSSDSERPNNTNSAGKSNRSSHHSSSATSSSNSSGAEDGKVSPSTLLVGQSTQKNVLMASKYKGIKAVRNRFRAELKLPVPNNKPMLLHLGEYDTCLEAVYAHDHALVGIKHWLAQTGKPALPKRLKANLMWSDFYGTDTLSGAPDMYGTPLYNYLLTMGETDFENTMVDLTVNSHPRPPVPRSASTSPVAMPVIVASSSGRRGDGPGSDRTLTPGTSAAGRGGGDDDEEFWFSKMLKRTKRNTVQ